MSRRSPYSTGYVAAKIRENTARRNGGVSLSSLLQNHDIVLGQSPASGSSGLYTAYFFESGIPGNPDRDDFWESHPYTGEPLWADEAEEVRVRLPAGVTAQEVLQAILRKLDQL
jgi:hypothetical protein